MKCQSILHDSYATLEINLQIWTLPLDQYLSTVQHFEIPFKDERTLHHSFPRRLFQGTWVLLLRASVNKPTYDVRIGEDILYSKVTSTVYLLFALHLMILLPQFSDLDADHEEVNPKRMIRVRQDQVVNAVFPSGVGRSSLIFSNMKLSKKDVYETTEYGRNLLLFQSITLKCVRTHAIRNSDSRGTKCK